MVGATCANVLACRNIASEVVLVDIKEGLSEGKMLDMFQASATSGYKTKLVGVTATDAAGYKATANSDVVVITSGIPRKPGMTREELIGINANIVKGVVANAIKWSPKAVFVIISNPMDTMTYLALKAARLLADMLSRRGVGNIALRDLARDDSSEALAQAFRFDRVVLAASTYDAGIFTPMEEFITLLCRKNFQNRRAGLIENGSWAPAAGRKMHEMLSQMKNIDICPTMVSICSAVKPCDTEALERLADELTA